MLLVSLGLLLSACEKADQPRFIGAWKSQSGNSWTLLSLRPDRTAALTIQGEKESSDAFGNYTSDDKSITLNMFIEGETRRVVFSILAEGKDELTVRDDFVGRTAVFNRISSNPGPRWPLEEHARSQEGRKAAARDAEERLAAARDKAVLSNARQLSAAADHYYRESGRAWASLSELVGPGKYVLGLYPVAGEHYPANYTQGVPVIVNGVSGARTITYSP